MTEQVDLLEQAKQHWPQIVSSLVGEPNKSMSNEDDIRYGTKGSLSIHPSKFVYKNYETGEGGGIIDFIKQENHFDTNYQVMTWLNEFLGSDHANTPPPQFENRNPNNTYTQDSAQRRAQNKKYALDTWNKSKEIKGTPVEKYLLGRGINLKTILSCNDIRFSNCKLPGNIDPGNIYPTMISLYRDIKTNEPVAIHRTYLEVISQSEVIKKQKANLGSNNNAVIKLSDDADVYTTLFVTEGIENAITALLKGHAPVWAVGSAGNLANFKPIPGIENLIIFADNDKEGLKSAENCGLKWGQSNVNVTIFKSPVGGGDLNDLLRNDAHE